jgi:2-oxoglutarate ferredoxin oxidoreductase subunit alpha
MKTNKISLIIGGEAGAGITRSGFLFGKACMRGGFHVFGMNDYQSLIRGGHNFYMLRLDSEKIYSQSDTIDLLLALNKETIFFHKDKLVSGGGVVYDGEAVPLKQDELGRADIKMYSVPMGRLVKELGGVAIMQNTVALGGAVALVDYDLTLLEAVISDAFKGAVAELNVKAARKGYDYVKKNYAGTFGYSLKKPTAAVKKQILLTGNEAVGLGAISAGCKFYSAYPMTPATPLLHFMAANARKHSFVAVQAEGEIAAINMAAGASFAGVRAMTATSGGGFCLMSEGLGMTGMTETSVVVMVGQRAGPSTGLPTYSSQADLRFVIHASQGEFPRVVIAPGDVEECFYLTMEAFNLAEKHQIPVIILTDKTLIESHESTDIFDVNRLPRDRGLLQAGSKYEGEDEYKRHKFTENGISPRVLLGMKGAIVRTNADEHDETGLTTEDPELTAKMMDKRFKKTESLLKGLKAMETVKLYGPEKADVTLLGWGSTKGPIREAMKLLAEAKVKVTYLQIVFLTPFPASKIQKVLRRAKKTVVVENNKTSQLTSLIKENVLMDVDHKILRYDGRPFDPGDLAKKIKEVL